MTAPASKNALTAALRELDRPIGAVYGKSEDWMLGGTIHLCVCGAPCFGQPCETCGYYPMGQDDREYERCALKATREGWVKSVTVAGNIAIWWLRNTKMKTVAYRDNPTYKEAVEAAIEKAKTMEWPSPERIWDGFETKRAEERKTIQGHLDSIEAKRRAREEAARRASMD